MDIGTADVFLYILHRVAEEPAVLVRRAPAQRPGYAPRAEPVEPPVELGHEAPGVPALPVPAVEELALEQAEEALHAGVVRARALARHAPDEAAAPAGLRPAGPSVVPAAVGVHDRPPPGRECRAGGLERRVRQPRGRRGADRPGGRPAVEAVEDGGEVRLRAAGQAELGDVRDPEHVGRGRGEVVGAVRARRQVRLGSGGPVHVQLAHHVPLHPRSSRRLRVLGWSIFPFARLVKARLRGWRVSVSAGGAMRLREWLVLH